MKRKVVAAKMTALILAAGMTFGSVSFAAERKDAEAIKEENQATEAVSEGETEAAEASDSQKKTEYPVTITTMEVTDWNLRPLMKKAPEKVLAVYQGCIETLLALGLEDHIVATAGLDNEVPEDQKAAFSKTDYLDEFTPSLETVTMLEPVMIFSWGSLSETRRWVMPAGWVGKRNQYLHQYEYPSRYR